MVKKVDVKEDKTIYGVFAVAIVLFGLAYLAVRGGLMGQLPYLVAITAIAVAVPTYRSVLDIKGRKPGLIILGSLAAYGLVIAGLLTKLKYPIGGLQYTPIAGNLVAHTLPWTVILTYPPILLLAYWLARSTTVAPAGEQKLKSLYSLKIAVKGAFFATLVALVVDTGALRLNFWHWVTGTNVLFYRVPVLDFAGWLVTTFVGMWLVHFVYSRYKTVKSKADLPDALAYSGLIVLWFWTSVNNWGGNMFPGIIGLVFTYLFGYYIFMREQTGKSKK